MCQNKIIKTLLTFVVGCSIIMAASSQSYGAVMAKPVIAIKEAVIGTGVRSYVRKYLNINTIRDEMEAAIQKNRKFDLTSRARSEPKSLLAKSAYSSWRRNPPQKLINPLFYFLYHQKNRQYPFI